MSDARRYPFIVLEGTDGSGKSTLRRLLHDRLNATGPSCFMVGQFSWLDPDAGRVIMAARTQRTGYSRRDLREAYATDVRLHQLHNIRPALATVPVIADRYIYSHAVYHEVLWGIPMEETLRFHRESDMLRPDAVIFVDTDADIASRRVVTRGQNPRPHENEPTLRRLHRAYQELFLDGRLGDPTLNVIRAENTETAAAETLDAIMPRIRALFPADDAVAHHHLREGAVQHV
ncbi:dTMP kinase [Paractinoplanes ferrugineus]|uniref:Thymidylate kinase n=1 Tax=Paractinoplanes ferrugineus TaxID=113564 RepID=A0A919J5A4_9ACTN|nr:AAA family ATPase [Actinoplanes ferrugineus]GIE13273.1 thymidylate kinase [Actinoplanes ferrugineus]